MKLYEAEARNTTRITQLESDLESVGSKYEKLLLEHADAITKLNRYSEAELLGETERCRWEKDKKLSEDRRQMLEKLSELGSVLVMMDSKEQDKLRALATKKD